MKTVLSMPRAKRWCWIALAALTGGAGVHAATAFAQEAWKPTRPITFIVPNAAAGTSDRTAREIQRIVQAHRFVEAPILIVNRPGGNGTIALNQLHASPGDGHVFLIMNGATLSAHITGLTPYSHADFTPLALMVDDRNSGKTTGSARTPAPPKRDAGWMASMPRSSRFWVSWAWRR